ncbi:tetratricopeptide repeat protein, partial [Candidatus Poribacteria bacterium]|nr:tetratricopeptide repeat protein [Candidatus Poribacteria bacterium]
MKMLTQSNSQIDHLSSPPDIIKEITAKSEGHEYIYRGEPECYAKVSSTLYREYAHIGAESLDLEIIQGKMLNEAKKLTYEIDDPEILIEIQHYGGRTNLIDFTTDYLIALFFACDGAPDKDGRVILQKTETIEDLIKRPRNPRHRIKAQKTVFVIPPNGFIEPDKDDIVIIPAVLKQPLLQYLRKHYDISTETIYNDLYSFIKNRDIHRSAYIAFYSGFTFQNIGDDAEAPEERQIAYQKAIAYYTEALEQKPDLLEAYLNRGIVYNNMDKVDEALENYNTAIQLDPSYTDAYYNRGFVYLDKEDLDQAVADFSKVIELNPEHAEAYYFRGLLYFSKEDFEQGLQDCNRAIQLNPDDDDTYNLRGIAYARKGNFDNAFKDYTKAIELQPDDADAYNNRGIVYVEKGELDNAIKDFDKAIELQPDYAGAY